MSYLILLLITCLTSCCTQCPQNYSLFGPIEFVSESALIQEGKFGIKDLKGDLEEVWPEDALEEYRETVVEDDILNVVLWHPTRKDLMFSITEVNERMGGFRVIDGLITIPGFDPVCIAGLSLKEASHKLKTLFEKEVKEIEVFLSFREKLANKVELTGLVQHATFAVDGKIRLYEIIAKAHIPPEANYYASYVLREGQPLMVDLHQLIAEGDMTQNIVMKGGDKIYIASPHEEVVLVMGEVGLMRPVPVLTGSLSLREALVVAHGIPYTGNANCIQVIRGGVESPRIFVISWNFMLGEPNNNLLLIPGDIVYVTQKPITKWNLFLRSLEPTMNVVLSAKILSGK